MGEWDDDDRVTRKGIRADTGLPRGGSPRKSTRSVAPLTAVRQTARIPEILRDLQYILTLGWDAASATPTCDLHVMDAATDRQNTEPSKVRADLVDLVRRDTSGRKTVDLVVEKPLYDCLFPSESRKTLFPADPDVQESLNTVLTACGVDDALLTRLRPRGEEKVEKARVQETLEALRNARGIENFPAPRP